MASHFPVSKIQVPSLVCNPHYALAIPHLLHLASLSSSNLLQPLWPSFYPSDESRLFLIYFFLAIFCLELSARSKVAVLLILQASTQNALPFSPFTLSLEVVMLQ